MLTEESALNSVLMVLLHWLSKVNKLCVGKRVLETCVLSLHSMPAMFKWVILLPCILQVDFGNHITMSYVALFGRTGLKEPRQDFGCPYSLLVPVPIWGQAKYS